MPREDPTFAIHLGRPYTAPDTWKRNAPCPCGHCPDCSRWTIFIAPLELTPEDDGACYSGSGLPVVMPLIGTVAEPWCVKLRTINISDAVYAGERMMEGTPPKFVIDGVECDYITIPEGAQVCICVQDGSWVVTGTATGVNEGRN